MHTGEQTTHVSGCQPGDATEDARHVALIEESGVDGDRGERQIGAWQQPAGVMNAELMHETADRLATEMTEGTRQVHGMYIRYACDVRERDRLAKVIADEIIDARQPGRAASGMLGRRFRDVIDELGRLLFERDRHDPARPRLAKQPEHPPDSGVR